MSDSHSVPPSRLSMLVRQVEKKVDQVHCDREIEHNRQQFRQVREIAVEAIKKSGEHSCSKESEIHEMKKDVRAWELWFRRAVFGFIGFLVVVGSGWLWQFFTLQNSVANTEQSWKQVSTSVRAVEQTIENIEESQDELREVVDKKVVNGDATKERKKEKHLAEIESMLGEMLRKRKRQR